MIEDVDLIYLRKLLNAHSKTAKEALYLETGKIPPKYIIIQRRLSFLKHILNSNNTGLLFKFYQAQKNSPVKNDWVTQIKKDKSDIGLFMSDENIAKMSKNKFKKLLKSHIMNALYILLHSSWNSRTSV